MFHKVLVANRGEIAVRIIRTLKKMGIATVAVHSVVDKEALHVQIADEAVCIGGNNSVDSYLKMDNIISAAVNTGAEAIHPGFGFLSENSDFARLCAKCGINFIGPSGDIIDKMGNKSMAREMMIKANVPIVPGSDGKLNDLADGIRCAKEIGYPVLIKASAGGGGRGMRVAECEEEFENAFNTARLESKNAFLDDTMYLEKFVRNPKHVEVQILADKYGNVIHLGERDCSIQRRNQKVVEETPCTTLKESVRKKMYKAAVEAAKYVKYENAGTIEFLLKGDDFYFIEMNTRIQVEHAITEMITNIDLIEEQIRIASGKEISYKQEDVQFQGHCIELRINAEDPKNDFRPSPGKVNILHIPGGLGFRFDSALYAGYTIPPFYDSMIGKVIVHASNRTKAIKHLRAILEEMIVSGVKNNILFLYMILHNPDYVRGHFDTSFLEVNKERLLDYDDE